jgi:hypothetical protein
MTNTHGALCAPSCQQHGSCWVREAGLTPKGYCTYSEPEDDYDDDWRNR